MGRKGCSAVDAVARLVEDIERNQEKQKITSILAVDIKSAFDNLHRDILLDSMKQMSVLISAYTWGLLFHER